MVTVGEHCLSDDAPAVDQVHDKQKIRQKGQHQFVDSGFGLWYGQAGDDQHNENSQQYQGNLFRGFGQQLGVALHKELIQVLVAGFAAGLRHIGINFFAVSRKDGLVFVRRVHHKAAGVEQCAVNGAELPETQHIGQREAAANDRQHSQRQEQRRAHGKPKCGQSIGQHQRRQHARPDHRRGQVFIARLFTVPAAP